MLEMAMDTNYGLIVRNMREIGKMIRQMGLENCFMLMEMYMKGTG